MAVTIANEQIFQFNGIAGRERMIVGTFKVTFDASYPTNGEVWNLAQWFTEVWHISCTPAEDGTKYKPAVTDTKFTSPTSILVELFCSDGTSGVNQALAQCTNGRTAASVVIRATVIGE